MTLNIDPDHLERVRLLVRFAGNEKGVAFQIEEALKLLKNGEVVTDDAGLWQRIAAERALESDIRKAPSGPAGLLMERIKKQLDPLGTLPAGRPARTSALLEARSVLIVARNVVAYALSIKPAIGTFTKSESPMYSARSAKARRIASAIR